MLPPGTQLKQPARRLLLEAAPSGEKPTPVLPSAPHAAAYASTRATVARLVRLGLIEVVGEAF